MSLAELVRTYQLESTSHARERILSQLTEIVNAQASVLNLVRELGPLLTSEQGRERSMGVELLSSVLDRCLLHCVNASSVAMLVEFYTSRLADEESVEAVLSGMLVFQRFDGFDVNQAMKLLTSLLSLNVTRYPQTTRYAVFRVVDWLTLTFTKDLAQQKTLDVVDGFIKVMDGEKDPRNLLVAFSIAQRIIQNFDITSHVEDFFDVLFCYFPITFRPPPNDPYGITAEDLKSALRKSLAASPLFANLATPLLLEKLSSSVGSAKKDALETLAACAPVYGATAIAAHFDNIWKLIKTEIFDSIDDVVAEAAVAALKDIAVVLVNTPGTWRQLANATLACCKNYMKESELKSLAPVGKTIRAVGSASEVALADIVGDMIPYTLERYRQEALATSKKAFLDILLQCVRACRDVYGDIPKSDEVDKPIPPANVLNVYKQDFIQVFGVAYTTHSEYDQLRHIGLNGYKELLFTLGCLAPNEAGLIIQQLTHVILSEEDNDIRGKSIELVADYAVWRPLVVRDVAFPPFLEKISSTLDEGRMQETGAFAQACLSLDVIAACAKDQPLFDDAIIQLLQLVNSLSELPASETRISYAIALFVALQRMLDAVPAKLIASAFPDMLSFFMARTIEPTLKEQEDRLFLQPSLIRSVAQLIGQGMRQLDEDIQSIQLALAIAVFVQQDVAKLSLSSGLPFQPLVSGASQAQQRTLEIFSCIVCHCRRQVKLPVPDVEKFLQELITITLDERTVPESADAIAQCVASILNKQDTSITDHLIELMIYAKALPIMQNPSAHPNSRKAALKIFLWCTRALALLAHSESCTMINHVIHAFKDAELARAAADGFNIIVGEEVACLNTNTFAVIRPLHRQKLFLYTLPMITDGFRNASEDTRVYYLVALSHLLANVPKQIMISALPPLVPLLVRSLEIDDAELKQSTLRVFSLMVSEAPNLVAEHAGTLIEQALLLFRHDNPQNTMAVRISALQFLARIPGNIKYNVIHPFKSRILRELALAVDDPKRLVRKEAVICRQKWYVASAK